jgi:Ala-tRNA(Pro) deacylase
VEWLERHDVDYETHEHLPAGTARATARAEGVDPRTFAKVVGVRIDEGRDVMLVLDATDRVNLRKARAALDADTMRLLTEVELTELAPGCEAGAIPAIGSMYGLPMYADHAVREDPDISFNAGSHRFSVRVDRAAWERATGVRYADLADEDDPRPAWDL